MSKRIPQFRINYQLYFEHETTRHGNVVAFSFMREFSKLLLLIFELPLLFQSGSKDKPQEGFKTKKCKLELLASFSLFGNIVSMQCVKLAGNTRDSLLLSFKEAKVGAVKPP